MSGRRWTKEDIQHLQELWGNKSVKYICDFLGRTENAVMIKVQRLGLMAFLDNGDYIAYNTLMKTLGYGAADSFKDISWIHNRNFPIRYKRVNTRRFRIVYIEDFWKWAKENRDLLDFSRFEKNVLGKEPDWVIVKRQNDIQKKRDYKVSPWTKTEDERLKHLLEQQKYTYFALSKMMQRTNGAIQRRIIDLEISDRPVKADSHNSWLKEDVESLSKMILAGYGYEYMSEKIGRSSKAIRGKVYRMLNTENLDKARKIMEERQ